MSVIVTPSTVATPPTTIEELVKCVRHKLGDWPLEDYLTADYVAASGGTLAVSDGTQWAAGDVGDFDDNTGTSVLIRSVSSNALTFKDAHRGTPGALDHASGAILRKRPLFDYSQIIDALEDACATLAPSVYGITTVLITPPASSATTYGQTNFTAPDDIEEILYAVQPTTTSDSTTIGYEYTTYNTDPHLRDTQSGLTIFLARGRPTAQFTNGMSFHVPSGFDNTTYAVEITYSRPVTTNTVSEGLMASTVCWGAVANLAATQGVSRSHPFNPEDPGAPSTLDSLRVSQLAQSKYDMGKRRIAADLARSFPRPKRWRG